MSAALRAPHIICFKSKRPQAYSRGTRSTTLHRAVAGNNVIPSFHGLGSANKLDMLCVRAVGKATPMRSTGNTRPMVLTCRAEMNVVFVGAEAAPWSKTGGLGDVLAGLPPALAARGHRVMSVIPRYDQYSDAWDTSVVAEFKVGKESHKVRFFHSYKDGVDRVFVDSPLFLEKVWGNTGLKLYGPIPGEDYRDNERRFSLLCQAALEAPRILNLTSNPNYSGPYGEDVVFVCNDWHTSLLPIYLKHSYKKNGIYRNAKSVHCIHNISYQGRFPFEEFENLGLPEESKNSLDFTESSGKRKINWIKGGIMETDKVLTVSPYYAEEIVSSPYKGMELENTLKKTGITGILNGMDDQEWNPSTDNNIPFKYDISTVMKAKPLVKEAFQAELGLPVDQNIPLIGFIARLEEQKGPDVFTAAIPEFMGENVQVVALGTGKKKFEKALEDLEEKYPNKLRSLINYSPSMVHKIVSGCDFMLIPSRFEPCGLIQMHAMKYGTVPIVASTGGLVDSVIEGYTGFHMGALNVDGSKVDPRDVSGLASTVKRAIGVYGTPTQERLVKNCMSQDFSWKEPAKKWEKVLRGVGAGAPIPEKELTPSARTVLVAA